MANEKSRGSAVSAHSVSASHSSPLLHALVATSLVGFAMPVGGLCAVVSVTKSNKITRTERRRNRNVQVAGVDSRDARRVVGQAATHVVDVDSAS